MGFLARHRFALGFALAIGLALLARWAMHPNDATDVPAQVEAVAPSDSRREEAQPPTIAAPADATKPAQDDSASPLETLRGRVIDAVTHEPVRQFELAFREDDVAKYSDEPPETRAFRSDDGRFEWRRALPDHWTLGAIARGYQRFELRDTQLSGGKTSSEIVLPLRRGHRLRGRVYDEVSGNGIDKARIDFREAHVARFDMHQGRPVYINTKKDGSFILDGVPPGRVTLDISARGHARREFDLVVEEATAPVEIGLAVGAVIAGHLAAADGVTPVAGAVGVFNVDEGHGISNVTDEAGEFSFEHLTAARYLVTGEVGGASVSRTITLGSNERVEGLVLALRAGHNVRGVVTGLPPDTLQEVRVSATHEGDAGGSYEGASVDQQGAYVVHGVPPGRARVLADVRGRRQFSKMIEMPADTDLTVNLNFPPAARLSGRVTRGAKPLSGAWVAPSPISKEEMYISGTSTTAKGEYVLADLPAGEYMVVVDAYRSRPVQVSGDTVFDIDVPLAQLSGRVLEAGSQVPIVGAGVEIHSAEPDSAPVEVRNRSDHFGQFALAGLEPGDFILTVHKPGYAMFRQRISYNAPVTGMTISLQQGKGVQITVHEAATGKPLRQVFVTELMGDRRGGILHLHLDEDGVGHIPEALSGSTLSFSDFGHEDTVIREWSGQALNLQLERRAVQ